MRTALPVERCHTTGEPVVTSCDRACVRLEWSACLDFVMRRRGMVSKELEEAWGCDRSFVDMVRKNVRPLTDDKFAQLPEDLQVEVSIEHGRRLKLLAVSKRDALRALAVMGGSLIDNDSETNDAPPMKMAK